MKPLTRAALILATVLPAHASTALVVDGNLADWKIDPASWVSSLPGVHASIEDSTGNGAYFLNPGWGGQAYDAEALYATLQNGRLLIALATGHKPLTADNPGANEFAAGDFAIDFGQDGTYELGINAVNNFPGGTLGGVYRNPVWAYGLWNAAGKYDPAQPDTTHPTSLLGGTPIGTAQVAYSTGGAKGYGAAPEDEHYFYEIGLDLSLLKEAGWDNSPFNIHWTQNCGNDSILTAPGLPVSEPGVPALLGVGLLGALLLRRRSGRGWVLPSPSLDQDQTA